MKSVRPICLFALSIFSGPLSAHGPTPQKAVQTIEIAASPEAVWEVVKDFDGIANWHPQVTENSGDGTNTPGTSQRTLTLENGEQMVDGLDTYDEAAHEYGYRLAQENVKALPVSFYTVTLKVMPADGGSQLEWKGRFYRGDTGNFPPHNLNDEAAVKAMNAFFKAGLEGLRQRVEQ